ncbi:hypothetical protein Aduo_008636 [Ancylostoma duodenale]
MSFEHLYDLQVQEFAQQLYATNLLISQNPAQLYRNHVQLPLLQQPGISQEAAPTPALPPTPVAPGPVEEEATEELIFSRRETFKQERCLSRSCSRYVTDDIFHKDPCRLNHNCIALNRYKEKAERSFQEIEQDKKAHRAPTQRHYSTTAKKILNMSWRTEEERESVGKILSQQLRRQKTIFCQNKQASEHLRRRGRLRQHKIDEAMDELQREMGARKYITTVTINNYCEGMSRYVTEKTI